MKKINVNGEEWFYEIDIDVDGFGSEIIVTNFFKEYKTIYRKKFIFFGKLVEKKKPIILFTVPFDIESKKHTRHDVRYAIERAIELCGREEEIKNGHLI